jgi:Family of unknown function (DUF5989)
VNLIQEAAMVPRMEPPSTLDAFQELRTDPAPGLLRELWMLVRTTGKWWLIPILIALLLLGAVALLSTTCYAPFIYTLF